jgi:hypothetical protein
MNTSTRLTNFYNAIKTAFSTTDVKRGFGLRSIDVVFENNIIKDSQIMISFDDISTSPTEQNFLITLVNCKVFLIVKEIKKDYFGDTLITMIDDFLGNSAIRKLATINISNIDKYSGELYYCELDCKIR